MTDFRAGKQIAPNYVVTAQQDADYLLREVANLTARNKYLQGQVDTHRDETEAVIVERDEARDSLRPWQVAALFGWVLFIVTLIARGR